MKTHSDYLNLVSQREHDAQFITFQLHSCTQIVRSIFSFLFVEDYSVRSGKTFY